MLGWEKRINRGSITVVDDINSSGVGRTGMGLGGLNRGNGGVCCSSAGGDDSGGTGG